MEKKGLVLNKTDPLMYRKKKQQHIDQQEGVHGTLANPFPDNIQKEQPSISNVISALQQHSTQRASPSCPIKRAREQTPVGNNIDTANTED